MAANSTDSRGWLRWFTPFGRLGEGHAYRVPSRAALVGLLAVPAFPAWAAVALWTCPDTAGALITEPNRARARLRGLGGPVTFAWRGTRGMLTGWLLGVSGYGFAAGMLIVTALDFMAEDPNYQRVRETIGWDVDEGFAGIMGVLIGLLIALYVCWRMGGPREEGQRTTGPRPHPSRHPPPVARRPCRPAPRVGAVDRARRRGVMLAGGAAASACIGFADMLAANLNSLPVAVLATSLAVGQAHCAQLEEVDRTPLFTCAVSGGPVPAVDTLPAMLAMVVFS